MAADKARGRQTVRDMVISLVVILLAAWVIYLFVPHGQDDEKPAVKTVSYKVEMDSARRAAPYPVVAPEGLPAQWRATSVRYEPSGDQGTVWHLGFMTPDDEYASVEQSDQGAKHVEEMTQGAAKTSQTQKAGGLEWTRWKGEKYDALVRTGQKDKDGKGTYTTVVTGTASFERLGELAGALTADGGGKEAQRGTPDGVGSVANPG